MSTPTEMSWDHHIVADDDQAVPEASVADPASAPAEETAWGPRIVAPSDDDRPPPEPALADPASATASAGSELNALASSDLPGAPDLRSAAVESVAAAGADAEKTPTDEVPAEVPAPELGPASASAPNGDSINLDVRWHEILAMFVDDPRSSVEQAAALADNRAEALVLSIKERQHSLRAGWQRHDTETEELRIALQQYRIFCNRLEDLSNGD